MKLIRIGIAATALASVAMAGVAAATPAEKVTICHGTASESNPYVEVTVSPHSFKDGHFDDGTQPSHGANNHPDFVLEDGRTCADGPGGGGGGGGGGVG